jgi:hypothetical protein
MKRVCVWRPVRSGDCKGRLLLCQNNEDTQHLAFSWLSSVFARECVKLVHEGLADPQFLDRTRISSPQLRETTGSELNHCTEIPAWEQMSSAHLTSLETVRICF